MRKYVCLIIFLSISLAYAFAQEYKTIDKRLNKCLLDSAGEYGRQVCLRRANQEWSKVISEYEKLITKKLKPDQVKQFNRNQNDWNALIQREVELFTDVVFKDYRSVMRGTGSRK